MKEEREYILFLEDMVVSIDRIFNYTQGLNYNTFIDDQKTIDAVTRNFEIIGEAANSVPIEIKQKYINVPWQQMYGLRNYASHEYFGISLITLWEIIQHNLSKNKTDIQVIINELKKQ